MDLYGGPSNSQTKSLAPALLLSNSSLHILVLTLAFSSVSGMQVYLSSFHFYEYLVFLKKYNHPFLNGSITLL